MQRDGQGASRPGPKQWPPANNGTAAAAALPRGRLPAVGGHAVAATRAGPSTRVTLNFCTRVLNNIPN